MGGRASENGKSVSRGEDGRVTVPRIASMTHCRGHYECNWLASTPGHVAVTQTRTHSLHVKPAPPSSQIASPYKSKAALARLQNDAVSLCHNSILTHQSGELGLVSTPKLTESYHKPGLST